MFALIRQDPAKKEAAEGATPKATAIVFQTLAMIP